MIKQLDNSTINKIAAGEVIESPKSIVKELVENSIDAKADEIIIEIKNGGKKYIRISDNGTGIKKDEIEDAFKRHYTSKIDTADDLDTLHTLGFRGEALASIAAVAKVEIISRTAEDISGTKLVIEGGITVQHEDIGCPIGTTIIVTDLFYNVPARLKFLKSDTSESMAINETVVNLSLCTTNVSFKYMNNGGTVFKTPKSTNMLNVISSLYDKDMVRSLIDLNYEGECIKVTGYTTNLNYHRGNRKYQLLFVNKRFIKHKRANFFIEAAYHTLLPKGKYPACFIKIEIDTSLIDVNVHPAKTEIRIKDEEKVLNELKNSLYKALRSVNLVKEVRSETVVAKNSSSISKYNEKLLFYEEASDNNAYTSTDNKGTYNVSETNETNEAIEKDRIKVIDYNGEDSSSFINRASNFIENSYKTDYTNKIEFSNDKLDFTELPNKSGITKNIETLELTDNLGITKISDKAKDIDDKITISQLKVIGMLFNTYILCESMLTNEFYMIDQHAAHERINYEMYLEQIENRSIILQELLIPEVINMSYEDYYLAISNREFFGKIGIPIESFGNNDILISSIPLIFVEMNIKDLFLTVLDSIKEVRKNSSLDVEMRKIIKNACVKSVKAGDNLHSMEIKRLIEDLSKAKNPYTCPHGRPTIIKMTRYEVERMFERIQI
jgi:DNA mismatch repair protein MutL